MSNNYYNPDYPQIGAGSFLQHTYAPANNNAIVESMYFNSGLGMMQQFDSRRNMGLNPNGFAPTNPFSPNQNMNPMMCGGYPATPVPQQESPVMPFSNYPPSVPQQQQQQPAFNSLVDSRRTATAVNNTIGSSPWSNQQQPGVMNQSMFSTQPQPPSPFVNQYGYTGQQTPYMYDTSILNGGGFGRRDGCWDNILSQPNVISQPVVDWNSPMQQQQYGYGGGMPMPQYPPMNISWREQAERNWAGVR